MFRASQSLSPSVCLSCLGGEVESHSMWSFVPCSFHSVWRFKVHPRCGGYQHFVSFIAKQYSIVWVDLYRNVEICLWVQGTWKSITLTYWTYLKTQIEHYFTGVLITK